MTKIMEGKFTVQKCTEMNKRGLSTTCKIKVCQ